MYKLRIKLPMYYDKTIEFSSYRKAKEFANILKKTYTEVKYFIRKVK